MADAHRPPSQNTTGTTGAPNSIDTATQSEASTNDKAVSLTAAANTAERVEKRPCTPVYCALDPSRRRLILALVSVTAALGPLSGAMYLPVLPLLESEFNVGSTSMNATVSAFMMTFAIAPLFWSSCADWKGRRPLYIVSLAVFMTSNVLLAVLPEKFASLLFLRVVHAFGSAAFMAMGVGTVADVSFTVGRAIDCRAGEAREGHGLVSSGAAVWSCCWAGAGFGAGWPAVEMDPGVSCYAVAGVVDCGAVGSARDAEMSSWKWPSVNYQGKSWLVLPRLRADVVPEGQRGAKPPRPSLLGYWKLFCYPPTGIVSVNTTVLYSTYFSMMVALPHVLGDVYRWSTAEVGAGYVAVGVGLMMGSLLGGKVSDGRRARMQTAAPGLAMEPESRLMDQIWGVLICVAGTALFGWFVRGALHVALVLMATFVTGFGMSWVFVATTVFLGESVPLQAAGAFALGTMLRNPGAAIAAVLYPSLVKRMGIAWFFTGFAALDLVLVGGSVVVLQYKGRDWRRRKETCAV